MIQLRPFEKRAPSQASQNDNSKKIKNSKLFYSLNYRIKKILNLKVFIYSKCTGTQKYFMKIDFFLFKTWCWPGAIGLPRGSLWFAECSPHHHLHRAHCHVASYRNGAMVNQDAPFLHAFTTAVDFMPRVEIWLPHFSCLILHATHLKFCTVTYQLIATSTPHQ